MTPTPTTPRSDPGASRPAAADDPRVVRALEEYAAALQHGERPHRETFLAGLPDAVAAALADCLDGLEFVHAAAPELSQTGRAAGHALPAEPLGDYQIVREVGRGGMGIVYEALQLSLGRPVALKVLPLAATMDPRQLQRFRHEAQAAAMLHHPNIVPVHGVGCERGVHYYAMQLIAGRSLAAVIDELRGDGSSRPAPRTRSSHSAPVRETDPSPVTPTVAALSTQRSRKDRDHYRRIAELIAQAADALEYAHSMGVVHRDVKPANLLLDEAGHLWVTDFGLAKLDTAASMTVSGDLLGTLRYMSPEQALARHGLVNHRTDVYSLGATLYELLTLRPAVAGTDKQELLRQLAFDEPVAPRRLDPTIPAELETVVLKALAKDPAERYPTAAALADDLRRWRDDKPILARRPTPQERIGRWVRRHRSVVWLGMLLLALVTAGPIVATVLIARERAAAVRERDAAIAQRKRAFHAINLLAAELRIARPGEPAGLQPVQTRESLEQALNFYEEFLPEIGHDPKLNADIDLAQQRLAQLRNRVAWLLATPPRAPASDVDRAIRLAVQAVGRNPHWAFWNTLGVARYRAGAWEQAIQALDQSRQLRGVDDSYNTFFLAMAHWQLGHKDQARTWYEKGADWMKPFPREPELVAFRAEAGALLGITNGSRPEAPDKAPSKGLSDKP